MGRCYRRAPEGTCRARKTCCGLLAREKQERGRPVYGSVVHTSSVAGYAGNFGQANYSAAKLAVCAFSQVIALEALDEALPDKLVEHGSIWDWFD